MIRSELLDREAEEIARELSDLAKSQLRRFYDHVQALDRRLKLEASTGDARAAFARLRPQLLMLKAKAVYAHGRGTVPFPLLQFIVNHTTAVKSAQDFEAFRRHFEAVVAFHGFYGKEG
ncbi:MAG: type III-A CRISPR-associated protein Csm2 [Bryobacteraceae bacterium]|nr:type III-A CRISPR-associated protein Csm2 [Bryobacteraceae bacterium]